MFSIQNLMPNNTTFRRVLTDAVEREQAAMRLAATAPDRLAWLLEEAQRRQEMHEAVCRERGWQTLPAAGLDSVYHDVTRGAL